MLFIDEQYSGIRLDKALTLIFPEHSRSYFQSLLVDGFVKVNDHKAKANLKLKAGDKLDVHFPAPKVLDLQPKEIPLDIVYEDENVLVINKQPGLVVHPGTHGSHADDSLVNAILHHCRQGGKKSSLRAIKGTLRPGIVHRLDKDTSGLMVVAKNDHVQNFLMEQFQKKQVKKVYYALLAGHLEPKKGAIDAPIGRSLSDRKKMAVIEGKTSKDAMTKYEVLRYYGDYTYVKVRLITGRTHQIRVHFASIGYPLVGDQTYGRVKVNHQFERHYGLKRQFLHAAELSFALPVVSAKNKQTGIENTKKEEFVSALPLDLQGVLDGLETSR